MTARPSQHTARRRPIVLAGLLLLLLAALPPGALARSSAARHAACRSGSHRARHSSHRTRCARHRKPAKHEAKSGPSHRTSSGAGPGAGKPAAQAPARCEDGTLPVHEASGAFTCDDESEPSCADGSPPAVLTGTATLACAGGGTSGSSGAGKDECAGEATCIAAEPSCETPGEPAGCAVEAEG